MLRRADGCTWFDPALRCCTCLIDSPIRVLPLIATVGQTPANQQCSLGDGIETENDCKSATRSAGFEFKANDAGKPSLQYLDIEPCQYLSAARGRRLDEH
jgi:hypothetical protein